MMIPLAPSVNFHLWRHCNMRCRFCFAGFEDTRSRVPQGHLSEDDCRLLNLELARAFDKVTYVGGEPTLCAWLPRLLEDAQTQGATTMLVTNGSRLSDAYLEGVRNRLDWLTLSIDSADPERHRALGRAVRGHAIASERYQHMVGKARALGMRIKVNTVVTALTWQEDMTEFIVSLAPERWKIFQALSIEGENDLAVAPLLISGEEFEAFIARHRSLEARGVALVPEQNEAMTGTYAMVDPAGRFFDNSLGRYTFSDPILKVGVEAAWSQITFDLEGFRARGGVYKWQRPG